MSIFKIVGAAASLFKEVRSLAKDKMVYGHEARGLIAAILEEAFKIFKLDEKMLKLPPALVSIMRLLGEELPEGDVPGQELRETVSSLLEKAFTLFDIDDKVLIDFTEAKEEPA